jgi:hypothetical protein
MLAMPQWSNSPLSHPTPSNPASLTFIKLSRDLIISPKDLEKS